MKARACRRGLGAGFVLAFAAAAVACLLQVQPAAHAEEVVAGAGGGRVVLSVDQARIVRLPERTATLVIGNPLIADASVQPGGIAVITAKSYGATNFVALDAAGEALLESTVQVVGPADKTVVVYRGLDRETYSCVPTCERRITIGDTPAYFAANLGQIGTFSTLARSNAAANAPR